MIRVSTLLRNLALAGGTAAEHIGDDPVLLALQISRRLPPRVLRSLLDASAYVPGRGTLPTLEALLRGDKLRVQANLYACAKGGARDAQRLRMADLATVAGLPDLAAALLKDVQPVARGRKGAAARLNWYNGNMRGAVAALDGGAGRERAQQRRLAAEARVFAGWQPELAPVQGYRPLPRTVLHVLTNSLPHTQSGYAQRSHSILKAQLDLGWNVHAVTRLGYPVQVGKLLARDTDLVDGVVYHRLLPARMPFGMDHRLQRQAEEMLELALNVRPSILHTTTHFTNGLVTEAVAGALGIPWAYEVRGQLADTWASTRGPSAQKSQRYRQFKHAENLIMNRASMVPTLGDGMAAGIRAAGVDPAKIVLLPNAVGEHYLEDPLSPQEARRQLGLPTDSLTIGTVSSIVDYEGLDDLLRAFVLIAPMYADVRCLIVGDGVALPGLRDLADELGISDRVSFVGRVDRKLSHLFHQALDIFVVPRKDQDVTRKVTPLKPVEALASQRPVVFSDLPALNEVVMDGVEGLAFQPESPEGLADALIKLIESPELRLRMGTRGRERVLVARTWASVAAVTTGMYEEMKVRDQ